MEGVDDIWLFLSAQYNLALRHQGPNQRQDCNIYVSRIFVLRIRTRSFFMTDYFQQKYIFINKSKYFLLKKFFSALNF